MLKYIKKIISKSTDQRQESGDSSTNLQSENIVINSGISYSDAKEIALDVFSSNFLQLKEEAGAIAKERAENITEGFLLELKKRNPEALLEFNQPAMQDAIFTVQKEYAKSGDKDLGDLLIDLLVDRAGESSRNMPQIILNESLKIAPKLTADQIDILTIHFLIIRAHRASILTLNNFIEHINTICKFSSNLSSERSNYSHMEYLGCGHIRAGSYGDLEGFFRKTYKAMFSQGFSKEEFENNVGNILKYNNILLQNFRDKETLQFRAIDENTLETISKDNNFTDDELKKMTVFFEQTTMSPDEIKKYIVNINNKMSKVFEVWNKAPLNSFEISNVGVAIAHANYRKETGRAIDLSNWIK